VSPDKKPFAQFYTRELPRCNKLYTINDPLYNSRNNLLRNATYLCKESENGIEKTKLYMNREIPFDDVTKLNQVKLDTYSFENIGWDENYSDINEIKPITMTIDINKNLHLITNPTKSNSINIMKEYNNEFLGQYLYPHKCSSNITQNACLKQCLDDKLCVGTEWNPTLMTKVGEPNKYIIESGVCCPKRIITNSIPRRTEHKHGHFYIKENVIKNNISSDAILTDYRENYNGNVNSKIHLYQQNQQDQQDQPDQHTEKYKTFNWNDF
jgi:hypothetical protein